MKQINIREALLELDRKTDARYDLTTLYEACKLDDEDKQQLVKYIDAYDHPAIINKFLSSKCDAITEALGDDDVSDMKIIDEINDGGDRTLWSLMNKFDDEDLQLKDLTEDVGPEVLQGRLDSIDYAMNHYVKDSFLIDDVQGSGKEWKVTYNDVTVDVTFDTDWEEYTYYINGKGPYAHSSYEYIASDVANFVDYNHLGQSDDEVDEALGDNRDVHSRTHMDSYDVYCTDCGQVTSHKFKGNFKDGEKELGRYICKECGCENDDDPINESLTEGALDENPIIAWLGEHEQAWEDFTAHFVGRDISELSDDEIIGWISEHDQLYSDYKNYFKVDECLNEGVDTSNLEPQIKEVVTVVMQENGYEADEIEAYTAVEIKDTVDDMIQVEVRAELGYDDLMELCDKLNPIVAAVDHRAYFEPVTSGIARAFIRNDQSQDIVDEEAVNQWTNKIYDCASMEDLRQVWTAFKDHIDNGQYTDGTVDAVLDEIHKKADKLNESLTEGYMPDDDEYDRIDRNGSDEEQLLAAITYQYGVDMDKAREYEKELTDEEKARAVKYYNLRMLPREVRLKKMKEMFTEDTSSEIRYQVTADMIDMDAVYSEHTNLKDAIASAREAQQSYTNVKIKDVRDGSSWQDIDNAEADLKDGLVESTKLTLNESDDTDILYDMEDYDEDNTTVTAGNSFIEDGHTWTWFRQCGDTVHLDFDNWAVWWAYRPEIEDDYNSTAISGFFVVDTDTGFIDWGPCDTVKEAQEFLQSKVNDWENDDLEESIKVGDKVKVSTPGNDYYDGRTGVVDFTEDGIVTVKFDDNNSPKLNNFDLNQVTRIDESKSIKESYQSYDILLEDDDCEIDLKTGELKVSTDVFDNFVQNSTIKVKFVEEPNVTYEYKMISADDEYITMEQLDRFNDELDSNLYDESKSIKEDIDSAASSLFDLLKDYGAISVDKDVDVTRISFRNSEDDSDATLVHHCILSKGYKELTQYGNNPNVTEYLNETGDTCVKLLIYNDSIAVELSAEDSSQYMDIDESTSIKESSRYSWSELVDYWIAPLELDYDSISDELPSKVVIERANSFNTKDLNKILSKIKRPELVDFGLSADQKTIWLDFSGDSVNESVDKDLTHCTECGKKLNDKGYCETEGCPNGTLKEGIEKYIIIAKEEGLNLYYNATDDNFGTDMKAATQYEERAVALDDYKAVRERYPNAYIRSMYDLPLLDRPTLKEGAEKIATDSKGNFLVAADSGHGYTAFNKNNVCIGGITTDDEEEAKNKFMSGKLDESYDDEWSDDELASIYGGDTKNDIPDGVETPQETEARLAKENALKESTKYVVVKADGTYAGVPCETEEEARELSNQHEGSKVHKIEG